MTKRHSNARGWPGFHIYLTVTLLAACSLAVAAQTPVPSPSPLTLNPKLPTLFVVGDSTANNNANGGLGWGDPFVAYFDSAKINVLNRARAGRSSRTFITEGLWDRVLGDMKPGDFVLIQFGHNDGGPLNTDRARGSLPGTGEETKEVVMPNGKSEVVHTYGWYMRKLANDTKAKGATPIFLSLTVRNVWKDGRVERGSGKFGQWAAEVATSQGVAFIDLTNIVADRYEKLGEESVKELFATDHTHTSPKGAELNAASVITGLKALKKDPLKRYFTTKSKVAPTTRPSTLPAPVVLTAQQDHQRIMDLLHITSLRPGADGRNPEAPNAANYDESRANPYPNLPDPLVLKNGKKVTSAKTWWQQRRVEIVEDFDREIYGRVPQNTPRVNWEVVSTTKEMNGDLPIITKKLVGHVDNSAYRPITVDIQLTLTTPASATGPVPVIMEFGFVFPPGVRPPAPPPGAPVPTGPTWQQQVLAKGWGYAVILPNTIQPDNGAGLTQGIIGLVNKGQPRRLDDWGALRAWAWGASRALDYFETDKSVDAKQVGLEGHSRYGKATIVAMAYDQRFAIAYVSSSGEGGARLHRRNWGELVENVAGTGEYHWMAGNFIKYAGPLNWNDLPVDSHELIALCAPRPVFISSGAKGDGWVDAKGMFMAAAAAGPVYRLLGKKDLGTTEFPATETPLIDGEVAYRQHSGGHTPGPNWPTFLTFASRYLKLSHPQAASLAR